MENRTLSQYWQLVTQGDEKAFHNLFHHLSKELLRYGYRFTNDQLIIEDSVQEVFITIWRRRKKLPKVDKPKLYIPALETQYSNVCNVQNRDIPIYLRRNLKFKFARQ